MRIAPLLSYGLLKFFYTLCRCFSINSSANFCAGVAKKIGPHIGVSKIGKKNLRMAFPNMSEEKIQETLVGCWENLGRVVAEICHGDEIAKSTDRFIVRGEENLIFGAKNSAIFLGAHLGNWEITAAPIVKNGTKINVLASVHKNPWIDKFILRTRQNSLTKLVPRTSRGSKTLLRAIQNKECIGALVDQRAQDGTFISFFNSPAKAPIALARLAIKHDRPIVPIQVSRVGKQTKFVITFHPPLEKPLENDATKASVLLMETMYGQIENWIKQDPTQWLWLHNRWKDTP